MNTNTTAEPVSIALIEAVFTSPNLPQLFSGKETHEPALKSVNELLPHTQNVDEIVEIVRAALPKDYSGDTLKEVPGMVASGIKNGFHLKSLTKSYDPDEIGPLPLGFTKEGHFAFRDQVRNIIISASSNQLLSHQFLLGLAPSEFWADQFPHPKSMFNSFGAGEALIAACKGKGPFNSQTVRGRGVWREGDDIIVNLGGPIVATATHQYLCFEPIEFANAPDTFDAKRLLTFLQRFNWRNPQDAMLLFGWLAIAPICGVLNWRPHMFVYGPPRCGKTTIHGVAARLLYPLVVSTDGQSSEAGIRQSIGPDSLPVIIDEFESDHHGAGLRGVLRLARSASSADNPVLRGTPEGRAMQFSLRTTFFFCAVNPGRMTPADQSRILLLELCDHGDDPEVARQVIADEIEFRELGPTWCGHCVGNAGLIGPAMAKIEPLLPSADKRHRDNFATLLAGAFVALHGRVPTVKEAKKWAKEYSPAVEQHAEDIERDNSMEALEHLFAHIIEDYPLGHWIAVAVEYASTGKEPNQIARRIIATYDIVVRIDGEDRGILIRRGSPNIEKIYDNTMWAGRGWERALRGLDGAFTVKNPVYFRGSRNKSRCVGFPLEFVPEPITSLPNDPSF